MTAYLTRTAETSTKFANLVDLVRHRSQAQAEKMAYLFLQDGEIEADRLTYRDLDLKARAIAAYLQSQGMAGQRALLLYPSGLEFITAFLGCLYSGVVAVPAYPPKRNHKMNRLQAIVENCNAQIVLTTASLWDAIQEQFSQDQELSSLHCVASDSLPDALADEWVQPEIESDRLAFLQYTSGSTGNPKGVMVSHNNLIHNERLIKMAFGHSEKTVFAGWLPLFHDMGLIGNVLQPLYLGIPCVLMSPEAFIQKPIRWLQAISKYKATTSGGPNFAYDLCVRKIAPEQCADLDLSSWDIAFNGAEPVRAESLKKFAETFAAYGFRQKTFYPCYGMAETTLFVAGGLKTTPPAMYDFDTTALTDNRVEVVDPTANSDLEIRTLVGCGQTFFDKINIVNPETLLPCAPDQVGEIWVDGASVAQGYWNQPQLSQETFQAHLADSGKGPFLRTGDLGFFHKGELFITGRLKDVVIIRGRNYYPQDIELTVAQSHPALKENAGAAFSVDIEGEERLVILQEVERTHVRKLDSELTIEAIRRSVSINHELLIYAIALLKPASILKTSSGKIQRRACKSAFLDGNLSVISASLPYPLGSEAFSEPESVPESVPEIASHALPSVPVVLEIPAPNPAVSPIAPSETLINPDSPAAPAVSKQRADDLIHWLRDYGNKRINSRLMDERRCIAPYIVLDFGNNGVFGMQVAEEYGGLALNNRDMTRVIEQIAGIDLSLATFVGVNNALGIRPIQRYANAQKRAEILPILAQGRELASFAVTEPGAGSAVRSVATQAIPDGQGGWKLYGTKYWSGSSLWAGYINVFAQIMDENNQPQGFAGFVVKQGSPGLRLGPEAMTMGMRGMVQNTIYLEGVPVTSDQLLGKAGEGFIAAQDTMMFARLGIAAMSLGGLKRCAQLMNRYASRRTIATGRLYDNPVTLTRLGDLTASITASEALVHTVTGLMDAGIEVPEEAMVACKTSVPEFLGEATDNLVQLLGARGYCENNMVPQLFRDARLFRIFEGPTETLNMHLGSSVIRESAPLFEFLAQTLGVPHISDRIRATADGIKDRCQSQSLFEDRASNLRWAYSLIGEMTTYGIVLATLQTPLNQQKNSDRHQRAIAWATLKFEQRIAQALSLTPAEAVVQNGDLTRDLIADYAASIGDIEQTLAGEDWDVNEFIRRDYAPTTQPPSVQPSTKVTATPSQPATPPELATPLAIPTSPKPEFSSLPEAIAEVPDQTPPLPTPTLKPLNPNPEAQTQSPSNGHLKPVTIPSNATPKPETQPLANNPVPRLEIKSQPVKPQPVQSQGIKTPQPNPTVATTPEAIQNWIAQWLGKELKIKPQTINPQKSFADYGLDSVIAVDLADDLGNWLNLDLDATIAWNFPTIVALSEHLMVEIESATIAKTSISAAKASQPIADTSDLSQGIESLSDSEIARLLSEEISKR